MSQCISIDELLADLTVSWINVKLALFGACSVVMVIVNENGMLTPYKRNHGQRIHQGTVL